MVRNTKSRYETGFPKYLLDSENKRMKKWFEKIKNPSTKICIKILWLGPRIGDAIKLKREYFSETFDVLTYKEEKTKKVNCIQVPEVMRKELEEYYIKFKSFMKEGFLFFANWNGGSKNKHLTRTTIEIKFKKMRKELGLEHIYYVRKNGLSLNRITPHTIRHFVAYRIYKKAGNDIEATRMALNHNDIRTTSTYVKMMMEKNKERELREAAFD